MKVKEKEKSSCKKYENCSAPLCPLEKKTIKNGIWYPDEEICGARDQQTVEWIKKQKLVAKADACLDKYFTADMLKAAKQIRKGIEGIDPDQPLDKAYKEEEKWVGIKGTRVIANEPKKVKLVVAKKKPKSSDGRKTITSLGKRKNRLT